MINISDSTINKICETQDQWLSRFQDTCHTLTYTRPLAFLAIALIMDILEPFIMGRTLSNRPLFEEHGLIIRVVDILFLYRVLKKMLIAVAIMLMVMQSGVYG